MDRKLVYNRETPVLFIVFNRLNTTLQVFEKIKKAQPLRLYVAADGPRNTQDEEDCEKVRTIFSSIDWKCDVKTLFYGENMGCRNAVHEAITWFFENEPEGIILEDDCIPADSFFGFCSTLLEKYRDDERIGHITGGNYQDGINRGDGSYYFSSLTNVWGWAGWRRVWKDYDVNMKTYPKFKEFNYIEKMAAHSCFRNYWNRYFQNHYEKADGWDFQYAYLNLINNRLSIIPNTNLITNIGFDEDVEATHPRRNHPFANILLGEINEIIHPTFLVGDVAADLYAQGREWIQDYQSENNSNDAYYFIRDKLTLLSKTNGHNMYMKIPRVIHQIYEDPAGPSESFLQLAETWKELNPTWEYRFWNKEAIENFLENNFPDFVPYYKAYSFNVQRWDAIRYLILYKMGGLYVDMDYECIEPIEPLLLDSTCCIGMELGHNKVYYNKSMIIGNAFIACVPGHSFFKDIINEMIHGSKYLHLSKVMQVMESTGPMMITRIYEQYSDKNDITLIPASLIAPLTMEEVNDVATGIKKIEIEEKIEKAYALHYFWGSWVPQTIT